MCFKLYATLLMAYCPAIRSAADPDTFILNVKALTKFRQNIGCARVGVHGDG